MSWQDLSGAFEVRSYPAYPGVFELNRWWDAYHSLDSHMIFGLTARPFDAWNPAPIPAGHPELRETAE
jgi:hypothetical protein